MKWYKVSFRKPAFQSKQDCDDELEKVKDLVSNAYPSCVVEYFIRGKFGIRGLQKSRNEKPLSTVSILYVKRVSEKVEKD